ncbi:hypothetical protein PMAYCL1PPCAC_24213 [Pristionchus mayeri]|uniref:ARID domain-containing protein n=1 Tax=Pristionchus mayeri TaxID=1317129 RepID=A0AAN5CZR6_9BILA|nr:hypothetical protein PMAYCL1PPCAC_24213 [Pristionchus mayeri]
MICPFFDRSIPSRPQSIDQEWTSDLLVSSSMSSTDSSSVDPPPPAAVDEAAAAAAASSEALSTLAAPPTENAVAQGTPVLNTLLSKPSESSSNPPSNAAPPFASPQQSPVPRGGPSRPESRDKYAATANAVAAGAGAPPRHPGIGAVQAHEWAQPRSPASPAGISGYPSGPDPSNPAMQPLPPPGAAPGYPPGYPGGAPSPHGYWAGQPRPGMPPAYGMPPGYPPYGMHPGQPHLAYGHPGYPGGPPPHPGMHPGMRPPPHMQPGSNDMVKMPPGPNPMEWAAMHRHRETNADGGPAPSPAGAPMTEEEKYRAGGPPPPGMVPQQAAPPAPPARKEISIVDRLVGPPTAANPPEVMQARRAFFDKLVAFCERHGEPITMIPQVSKQNVDLHRLYIAVRNKGGFEQVTKEKAWKMICSEANPEANISESSAAGYQLRRHYQKHLLLLECMETGRNAEDAVAFADKLKKKKKDPNAGAAATPGGNASTPGTAGTPSGPGGVPASASAPSPFPGGPPPGYYGAPGGPAPPGGWPPPGPHGSAYPGYPGAMRPPNMPDPSTMSEEQRAAFQRQQQVAAGTPTDAAPATPYSQPPATPVGGGESRAPSAPPPATPDSSSRLSAPDTIERPASQASNAAPPSAVPPSAALTPTPGAAAAAATSSAPSTSMAATPHYGQPPPMYSGGPGTPGGGRPPMGGPGASPYPGYPPQGAYPGYPPHMQPHPQYMQHQMWAAQQQQQQAAAAGRGYPGGGGVAPGGAASTPQTRPFYPQQQQQPGGSLGGRGGMNTPAPSQPAPSPGGSNAQRIRGYSSATTPAGSYPPSGVAASATPLRAPPPMAAGAAHAGTVQPAGPAGMMMNGAFPPQSTLFPPGSVEASSISQRRRRKMLARDLIGATPRRLLMTLRSALDSEVVWAVNALTVLLHDDSFSAPALASMPGILNAVVDHLLATLHVLWPDEFELPSPCTASSSKEETEREKMIKDALRGVSEPVKGVVGVREKKGEKNGNYTKTTRTGRKVHFKEAEMPEELRRRLLEDMKDEDCRPSSSSSSDPSPSSDSISGSLVNRAVARLRANLEAASQLNYPRFRIRESCGKVWSEVKEEEAEEVEEEEETISPFFYRLPNKMECAEYPNDVELETFRPTALINRDAVLLSLTHRALALSNIIRGFSFCHGNEQTLAAHPELLRILGKFLKLCVNERLVKKVKAPKPEDSTPSHPSSLLDSPDSSSAVLQEVAVQLREDSFTVLAHLSVVLDLYEMDSSVSYPIMDGLVHWAVSATAEATDNLLHGIISPRDYALEALCKLCVLERNVDLLLSTGPWPRTERLVKVLTRLLPMHEESHHREFAIVILNAMCLGSEAVCWTTAVETNAIHHLLNFIEISDHNMHTVMQSHGMGALRDNPEMMGTSVGMLRRAASIIKMLTKVSDAYKTYSKYQSKLIQFTMSQLMDSRVAGMIAESLYEIQQSEGVMGEKREEEEKEVKKRREERREEDKKKEREDEGEEKVANGHSPTSSEGSTHDSTSSANQGKKGMNGVKGKKEEDEEEDDESEDSQPVRGRKRGSSQQENGRDAKRCKGENGFPSPDSLKRGKNGEISASAKKSLKMGESARTENGSAMTAVA